MLRPLLYLSAVIAVAAAQQTFTASSQFDISSCPIAFYGCEYDKVYVNFTRENFVVCFTGFFKPETRHDCIVGTPPDSESAGFQIYSRLVVLETIVLNNVPTIKTTMDCLVMFSFKYNGGYATLALMKFRTQSALYVYSPAVGTVVVDAQVNGDAVDSVKVTNTPGKREPRGFLDTSGCRHSGVLYKPGTQVNSPETCFSLTCDNTAVLETSSCGPMEYCHGNGSCIFGTTLAPTLETTPAPALETTLGPALSTTLDPALETTLVPILLDSILDSTCTVIGPAIIDIHSQVNWVEDRCTYSLLSAPSVPGFHVLATFRERRRKDVSFLDSVTLRLDRPGVHIHLEQGGRVRLNESTLTLNSSAQLVHGVELSKDQTGLRAKVLFTNLSTSVFFDGNVAQIHLEGPALPSLLGLCGNSSRSSGRLSLSEYSSTSCETQHSDTADRTINCTKMAERCSLLKEAPFSTCNTDPQPFITACTNTLCRYPDLDGLRCQFLEAFVRTCRTTLQGWRSKAECFSSGAACQNRTCSAHEFCGEKTAGGETRCFCRALFASKYRETDSLGDPAVCSQNSASVSLPVCLLEDKDIDYSDLHLNDQTCRGRMDQLTHMVTFSFRSSSCGTEVTSNSSHIMYKNTIRTQTSSSAPTRNHNQVSVDLSCIYSQDHISTIRLKNSFVVHVITSGVWNYTVTMKTFKDADRTQAVGPNAEVFLNQKIWVELDTKGLDGDMVTMVTDSCWATSEASSNRSSRYDLIRNGCPNPDDQTVEVEGNGRGASNFFSFNMFEFSESSGDVCLHCKLLLCIKQGDGCIPDCSRARRRRSLRSKHEAAAFTSLVWTS